VSKWKTTIHKAPRAVPAGTAPGTFRLPFGQPWRAAVSAASSRTATVAHTALYSYNLACYEAQLRRTEKAKLLLKECFAKVPKMRQTALDDLDIQPVWDSLAEG
jgi:hypothetical protein